MVIHVCNKQISFAVVGHAFRKIEQGRQCFAVFITFLCSAADVLRTGVDNIVTGECRYFSVGDFDEAMYALTGEYDLAVLIDNNIFGYDELGLCSVSLCINRAILPFVGLAGDIIERTGTQVDLADKTPVRTIDNCCPVIDGHTADMIRQYVFSVRGFKRCYHAARADLSDDTV